MEDPMLSPVTVEVAHSPSPWADLVAGHVVPAAVARGHVAPSRKRQGNVVVQGGNPAAPAATVRAPGANAAVRSQPAAEKASKAAGVERRKVPASRKLPYSTSEFTPPPHPQGGAPAMPLNDAAPPGAEVFDEMAGSGGSNNATTEFMNMLDTNAVDIDQASFEPFNYNETDGGVDDHGATDELEEIEAEAFEQSQAKSGKSQRSKNYTILEDQALIQAWSAVSLDACTGVSQTAKIYWQRIEDQYFRIMKKYPNRTTRTFWSLQGRWENIKPMCSRWAACLEQIQGHGSFRRQILQIRALLGIAPKVREVKLIDKESPPKRGSLINMDEDEDDDGPRNLHKPDGDKKTKEKMKREQEAASLREKIDAMVQSNELMLLKSLEIKKESAEKKAKEKQENWQMLKEEGLRKAAIEERKARASKTKSMSLLLAEENKIMSMNRNYMDDPTKTCHDMATREILKRRMVASTGPCSSSGDVFSAPYGANVDDFGAGVETSDGGGFGGADELQYGLHDVE
ncbi:putative galacturonosyltransferase 14 [Hordeum vulgare]|nr:putative galacturonosyltransferase 14 [Hordeum vulgare]